MNIIESEKIKQKELKNRLTEAFKSFPEAKESLSAVLNLQKQHEQSLINLKEHMEKEIMWLKNIIPWNDNDVMFEERIDYFNVQIKELTKLIEDYE